MIEALSYVIVSTRDLPAWITLASENVGMQVDVVQPGAVARFRLDEKYQRFVVSKTDGESAFGMGYTVTDAGALQQVADRLTAAGFALTRGTPDELALRGVADMLHFRDPDGFRVEIAHGLKNGDTPFTPGRPLGGFRTRAGGADLGIGHTALLAGDYAGMRHLYRDVLGFKASDYVQQPFKVEFFHVNPRHHTMGLAYTGTSQGLYHLMLEYKEWDDVGRAYDMALDQPESIGVSLGRHANDHVTSFYLRTPDGWMLELGWAGRLIGKGWQVSELPGMSLWGHDRTWLPDDKRALARQMLRDLSAAGVRAPVAQAEPEES